MKNWLDHCEKKIPPCPLCRHPISDKDRRSLLGKAKLLLVNQDQRDPPWNGWLLALIYLLFWIKNATRFL